MVVPSCRAWSLGLLLALSACNTPPAPAEPPAPRAQRHPARPGEPTGPLVLRADGVNTGLDARALFVQAFGPDPLEAYIPDPVREVNTPDQGPVFEFMLPATGGTDPKFPDRQRNEVKVYDASQDRLKAFEGETTTYRWRFRIDPAMTISTRFCHLFQLKPVGGDDKIPLLTFTVADDQFQIRHQARSKDPIAYLRRIPYARVRGVWLEATVTVTHADHGALRVTLNRLGGSSITSYSNRRIDMWRGGGFDRPKWGIYRATVPEQREARVQFALFEIRKGG